MRQSQLFSKTRFEDPADEVSKNAKLLIRAGFIHKEMAGVYSLLPLGLLVSEKIQKIIKEEMQKLGGQEILMSSLQDKSLWEKSGRWSNDVIDNWFKTKVSGGGEVGLGLTHEEPITNMLKNHIKSFKDLPFSVFQFQKKFRNEARAKSGVLRCREFLMKDLYSFSKSEEEHQAFYEKVKTAYLSIFRRVGIGEKTFFTFASGGSFSKYSHEFQTLTDAGEDIIYADFAKNEAINKEVFEEKLVEELKLTAVSPEKAVEVGNIFTLGTRYSDSLGLNYKDESGAVRPIYMGSYGIGIERLLGTIVEVLGDEKSGMVWPRSISPFNVHLIILGIEEEVNKLAEDFYSKCHSKNITCLFDDRDTRAGEKFADADFIGIPIRVIISKKTLESKTLEVIRRDSKETLFLSMDEFFNGF